MRTRESKPGEVSTNLPRHADGEIPERAQVVVRAQWLACSADASIDGFCSTDPGRLPLIGRVQGARPRSHRRSRTVAAGTLQNRSCYRARCLMAFRAPSVMAIA